MDEIIKALAVNVPAAAAVIATVFMFLSSDQKRDERRAANAKEKAIEDREHQLKVNQMWTSNIKIVLAKQDETFELISKTLTDHEAASKDRYERMNITQELIKAVKDKKDQ